MTDESKPFPVSFEPEELSDLTVSAFLKLIRVLFSLL